VVLEQRVEFVELLDGLGLLLDGSSDGASELLHPGPRLFTSQLLHHILFLRVTYKEVFGGPAGEAANIAHDLACAVSL